MYRSERSQLDSCVLQVALYVLEAMHVSCGYAFLRKKESKKERECYHDTAGFVLRDKASLHVHVHVPAHVSETRNKKQSNNDSHPLPFLSYIHICM